MTSGFTAATPIRSLPLEAREPTFRALLSPLAFWLFALLGGTQSVLNPVGPQEARISRVWWLFFYVCTAVFIIVLAAILVAVYRSRPKRDEAALATELVPEPQAERRMAGVVGGAVLLTGVILFVFLIASFRTGKGYYTVQDERPVNIKVTGHQWWWEVEYDDPVPSNTFKTANEIHIPVGRLVQLQVTSTDVIHSFWAPSLDGKKDLLPGHDNNIWLKADREGEFGGQCAEFCGHQHAHMRFLVIAEPEEKFNAWVTAQRKPAASLPTRCRRAASRSFSLRPASCATPYAAQMPGPASRPN
jgi:cytochrome c oxidase subunit II